MIKNWYTISEYVDIDTGEQISKKEAQTNYIIINKIKTNEIEKTTGIIKYTNECKRNPQLGLFPVD